MPPLLALLTATLVAAPLVTASEAALGAGFEHFYNNEYDTALASFQAEAAAHPNDPRAQNAIAQAILYREMYRDGALESELVTGGNAFLRRARMEVSKADRTQFDAAIDRAMSLATQQLQGNARDVEALNALAVAHGLRANFLYLVDKSWRQSLHESVAARKANDRILQIDPGLIDAHLLRGLSEYVVGCLPRYLRLVAAFDGFHGDKEDGLRQLQLVYQKSARNRYDAAILLAAIYRRERRPKDALPLLQDLARRFPRNHLFPFEEVQMYSDLGDKSGALAVLARIEEAQRARRPGYAQLAPERVEYARGNLLFWYGDLTASLADLKRVVQVPPDDLDLNTAVMARLRLGQVCDLMGDRPGARAAYQQAMATAPRSEPAREAASYLERPYERKAK